MHRKLMPLTLAVLLVASFVLVGVSMSTPSALADGVSGVSPVPGAQSLGNGCPKNVKSGCCSCNIQKYKIVDPCNGNIVLGTFCGAPGDCCAFPCCF